MKKNEIDNAKANKVDPIAVVFAVDGLSVIINPKNTIKSLTVDQIGQIYRGELTNWKQVGGPDLPVTLYGRQPNSGTFVFFREAVVRGDYSNKMNQMNGNAQILEAVKKDAGGIGYVGIGYVMNEGKVVPGIHVLRRRQRQPQSGLFPFEAGKYSQRLLPHLPAPLSIF